MSALAVPVTAVLPCGFPNIFSKYFYILNSLQNYLPLDLFFSKCTPSDREKQIINRKNDRNIKK
jgi:hypothetical protein